MHVEGAEVCGLLFRLYLPALHFECSKLSFFSWGYWLTTFIGGFLCLPSTSLHTPDKVSVVILRNVACYIPVFTFTEVKTQTCICAFLHICLFVCLFLLKKSILSALIPFRRISHISCRFIPAHTWGLFIVSDSGTWDLFYYLFILWVPNDYFNNFISLFTLLFPFTLVQISYNV